MTKFFKTKTRTKTCFQKKLKRNRKLIQQQTATYKHKTTQEQLHVSSLANKTYLPCDM